MGRVSPPAVLVNTPLTLITTSAGYDNITHLLLCDFLNQFSISIIDIITERDTDSPNIFSWYRFDDLFAIIEFTD